MIEDFKQESNVLKREFSKRTIYNTDQFYDLAVTKTNDILSIECVSNSQQMKISIGGDKELIEKIIEDLKKIIEL